MVPHCAARGAYRGGVGRERDLWSGTAERAGGEVAVAGDGGVAAAGALDLVLQSCRGGRLDGVLAGEAAREARTVEGQRDRHAPLCAIPSAQLDGRIRTGPLTTSHSPPVDGYFRDISAIRTDHHHVAVNNTNFSVLVVGMFHSSFNVTASA